MRAIIVALASASLLAVSSLSASAADMPAKVVKAPVAVPMTSYNWTGFYSATGLGGAWTDINGTYVSFPGDHHNTSGNKFNYASMIGAQYQWGNWVLGIEGAYNKLLNKDYNQSFSVSDDCLGVPAVADRTCSSRVDNIWTVGARVGYAWDRWMVFGTGGYANGKVYTKTNVTSTGALTSDTVESHGGWYAGVGAEYFVTKFWMSDVILGVEYQHIDLGTERHFDQLGVAANTRDMDATVDLVRARLVFKWSPGPSAIVTKY
jgi:outer membrane immunogenic protein